MNLLKFISSLKLRLTQCTASSITCQILQGVFVTGGRLGSHGPGFFHLRNSRCHPFSVFSGGVPFWLENLSSLWTGRAGGHLLLELLSRLQKWCFWRLWQDDAVMVWNFQGQTCLPTTDVVVTILWPHCISTEWVQLIGESGCIIWWFPAGQFVVDCLPCKSSDASARALKDWRLYHVTFTFVSDFFWTKQIWCDCPGQGSAVGELMIMEHYRHGSVGLKSFLVVDVLKIVNIVWKITSSVFWKPLCLLPCCMLPVNCVFWLCPTFNRSSIDILKIHCHLFCIVPASDVFCQCSSRKCHFLVHGPKSVCDLEYNGCSQNETKPRAKTLQIICQCVLELFCTTLWASFVVLRHLHGLFCDTVFCGLYGSGWWVVEGKDLSKDQRTHEVNSKINMTHQVKWPVNLGTNPKIHPGKHSNHSGNHFAKQFFSPSEKSLGEKSIQRTTGCFTFLPCQVSKQTKMATPENVTVCKSSNTHAGSRIVPPGLWSSLPHAQQRSHWPGQPSESQTLLHNQLNPTPFTDSNSMVWQGWRSILLLIPSLSSVVWFLLVWECSKHSSHTHTAVFGQSWLQTSLVVAS